MGNSIRVDTEALNALADRVGELHKTLSAGPARGSLPDLSKVGEQNVSSALGTMAGDGDGTSAFSRTYDMEHDALIETYNSMIAQLAELQNRCRQTAAKHGSNEQGNTNLVNQSGGEI